METIVYTLGMIILWVLNLVKSTGLGHAYHILEITQILTIAAAVFVLWQQRRKQGEIIMDKRYFYTLLCMTVLFVGVSLINGQKMMGLQCLWAFSVVYILANTQPERKTLQLVGFCYAGLGLAILVIFNYMDILDGWNANSIAMIGLFSYLVFIIPYYGSRDMKSFLMLTLAGAAYVFLLWKTESRSCVIAIILSLVLTFRVLSIEKLMASRPKILISLFVPLLVVILVCLLSLLGNVTGWDEWSLETFGKPIFNGRDTTWLAGLSNLRHQFLLGDGVVNSGYWHNSALTCLLAYGAVGYGLWLRLHYLMLSDTIPYQADICVQGCVTAFVIIFWQQSVELGLFAENPNLIPYAILGIMLGRCNYLGEEL